MTKAATWHSYDTKTKKRSNLLLSEIVRRKSRMIGSDDLQIAANMCRWASQSGIRGSALIAAEGLVKAFDSILALSKSSNHYEAAKKCKSLEYILKRNESLGRLNIPCRDGKSRKLIDVVSWFADRHFRIANDIAEAEETEARMSEIRKAAAETKIRAASAIARGTKVLNNLRKKVA
jgi:hypothetical protein